MCNCHLLSLFMTLPALGFTAITLKQIGRAVAEKTTSAGDGRTSAAGMEGTTDRISNPVQALHSGKQFLSEKSTVGNPMQTALVHRQ